jgi:hypothetical protein
MSITYSIDRQKNVIFETWTGEISADDLAAYWKRYLADPAVLEIRRTIVDLRGSTISFSGVDLKFLIQTIVLPVLKDRDWTTAIIAIGGSAEFGVSRQYQVFADCYSKDSIFGSAEEAEAWICS